MGYVRVAKGHNALKLEEQCSWAVPDTFTAFPDVGEAAGAEGRLPAWRTVPRQPASKGPGRSCGAYSTASAARQLAAASRARVRLPHRCAVSHCQPLGKANFPCYEDGSNCKVAK